MGVRRLFSRGGQNLPGEGKTYYLPKKHQKRYYFSKKKVKKHTTIFAGPGEGEGEGGKAPS